MENDSGQASSRRRPRRPPSSPHDSVLLQLPSHTSRPTREQSPRDVDLSRGSDGRARQSVSIPAPAGPLPSAARELDQILRKRALGNKPDSEFNNFFTPDNDFFCAQRPYKPLNPNRNEIRLLRVFPPRSYQEHAKSHPHWEHTLTPGAHGYMVRNFRDFGMSSPDTPVLCLELTDKVPISRISGGYCTISYCAGSPSDTSVVIVDGLPFMAFANLEHAIRNALGSWQTRHPGKALLIWADQICINQQDHTERALQVAMMQDVYRRCDETFVCLSTPGSPNHLSWATTLNAPTGPLANLSSYFGKLVERELDHFAPGVLETPQSQLDPGGGLIHAFLALMECKWWRRSWVFQEFISSPRPIFMSQATSLSWKHLDAALQFLLSPRFTEMVRTKVTESEAKLVVLVKKQVEAAAEQRERQLQALSAWERRKGEHRKKIEAYFLDASAALSQYKQSQQKARKLVIQRNRQWQEHLQRQIPTLRAALAKVPGGPSAGYTTSDPRTYQVIGPDGKIIIRTERALLEHREQVLATMMSHYEYPPSSDAYEKLIDIWYKKMLGAVNNNHLIAAPELSHWHRIYSDFQFTCKDPWPSLPATQVLRFCSDSVVQFFFDKSWANENPASTINGGKPEWVYDMKASENRILAIHEDYFRKGRPTVNGSIPAADEAEQLGMIEAGLKKWHADLLGQYNQLHSAMPPMIDIKRRTNRYVDLKPLLEHSRYCQATDPRDRVYAFIGLLPRDSYNITPDYRRANTIVHVLLDTARAIIEYEDGLGILRHVYRGRDNLGTLLPTWVPDWTSTKVDDHLSALISSMSESAPHTPKAASSPNQGRHCEDHHISRFEFRKSDEDDDTQIALGVSGFKIGRLEEGEEEGSVQLPGLQLWVFYQTEPWKARLDAETRALTLGMALPDDEIWFVDGASMPLLLRPEGQDCYSFCGEVALAHEKSSERVLVDVNNLLDPHLDVPARKLWIV